VTAPVPNRSPRGRTRRSGAARRRTTPPAPDHGAGSSTAPHHLRDEPNRAERGYASHRYTRPTRHCSASAPRSDAAVLLSHSHGPRSLPSIARAEARLQRVQHPMLPRPSVASATPCPSVTRAEREGKKGGGREQPVEASARSSIESLRRPSRLPPTKGRISYAE